MYNHSTKISLALPLILGSFLINSIPCFAENFSDIKEGNAHYVAISALKEKGIIKGYDDNTFKSKNKITRAEALKMLVLASGKITEEDITNMPDPTKNVFTDVQSDKWYAKYLQAAKDKKIISGYDDGSFKPEQNINLVEVLKIYFETLGDLEYPEAKDFLFADTPEDSWYIKYTAYAKQKHLLDVSTEDKIFPDGAVSRGYVAEILYREMMVREGSFFGKASYYSAGINGHGTMLATAHKTLPKGTVLEVKNLANGKSVKVIVNDRGPFTPGREIDLSTSAFEALAALSSGVMNVEYKVLPDEKDPNKVDQVIESTN